MNKITVFYHDHCTDGFGAAFVFFKKFGRENVDYIPCSYNEDPPLESTYEGRDVLILDFSFPLDVTDKIIAKAARFTWLDHHKTAFEMMGQDVNKVYSDLKPNHAIFLDNNRSGALMAYDWFFGRGTENQVPAMISHIDDRDRWQFKMEGTREFHAALQQIKPWSFEQWDQLEASFEDYQNYLAFVQRGSDLLAFEQRQVESAALKGCDCSISYEDAELNLVTAHGLAVNSTVHMSEVGHALANSSGTYGMIYFIDENAKVKVSLRSNGDYDVSVIAKHFGGGGHRNAAGFTTDFELLKAFLG